MTPKKKRPFGRLPQCSKTQRLQRRRLGQWKAEVQLTRGEAALRVQDWSPFPI